MVGQVTFWPFLNSSGWWWLISSVFLMRMSYHKITHTDGYHGAWPGWAVSVSVFPLTEMSNLGISGEAGSRFTPQVKQLEIHPLWTVTQS